MIDMMVGALSDPFDDCHMGVTAENVAKKWKITREDQDKLAVESHRRAANAIDKGYFKEQIVPVEIKVKGGTVPFETDETRAPRQHGWRSWPGSSRCSTRTAR